MKPEQVSEEQVNLIERHLALADVSIGEIAKIFNLRITTIKRIKQKLDKDLASCYIK